MKLFQRLIKVLKKFGINANKIELNKTYNGQIAYNDEKDFYKFTTYDLIVEDYQAGEQIKNIPIAV